MITLHREANAEMLGLTRIYICTIWLLKLSMIRTGFVSSFDMGLYYPQGIMNVIPRYLVEFTVSSDGMPKIQCALFFLFCLAIIGFKFTNYLFGLICIILVYFFGILKGFGGHVNHRELVLLYCTFLLCVLPCFDRISFYSKMKKEISFSIKPLARSSTYSASLQIIAITIILSYFFVGFSRLIIGFPEVFHPEVMRNWIFSRNVRPHPEQILFGISLLKLPAFSLISFFILPFSTLIEILFPCILFCNEFVRVTLILLMICFHVGIYFTMGISFTENILLLPLCSNVFFASSWQTCLTKKLHSP